MVQAVGHGFAAKDLLASRVAWGTSILWRLGRGKAEYNFWKGVHRFLNAPAKSVNADRLFLRGPKNVDGLPTNLNPHRNLAELEPYQKKGVSLG